MNDATDTARSIHVLELVTRPPFQWGKQSQAMGKLPLFEMVGNVTAGCQILFLGKNGGAYKPSSRCGSCS